MGGAYYPFNMAERNQFKITMDEGSISIKKKGKSVTISAIFHNENYRVFNRNIGLYTYFHTESGYVRQEPRAFVTGDIEPFGEKRIDFTLDNLDPDKLYSGFFYYYPDATNTWKQMSDPHLIFSEAKGVPGDAYDDGIVTVADVMLTVGHVLGTQGDALNFINTDLNNDGEITITDVMLIVDIIRLK